jgi:hypothetical protein
MSLTSCMAAQLQFNQKFYPDISPLNLSQA